MLKLLQSTSFLCAWYFSELITINGQIVANNHKSLNCWRNTAKKILYVENVIAKLKSQILNSKG